MRIIDNRNVFGGNSTTGGSPPAGYDPCPNILSYLIGLHGQAQGILFYQQRFGNLTLNANTVPVPGEPTGASGYGTVHTSTLSGQELLEVKQGGSTTGDSERENYVFHPNGLEMLFRGPGSGSNSDFYHYTDLDNFPGSAPTRVDLNAIFGNNFIGNQLNDWEEFLRSFWWDESDSRYIYGVEGNECKRVDITTGNVTVHETFTRNYERVGDASSAETSELTGNGRVILITTDGALGDGDQNGVFVYEYDTNNVVFHDETSGANYGDELFQAVDGLVDEVQFFLEFGGGGDDTDYVALSSDASHIWYVDFPGAAVGGTGLYSFNGTFITELGEAANHADCGYYWDALGVRSYAIQQSLSIGNTNTGDFFDGFDNRDLATIVYDLTATATGWDVTAFPYDNGNFDPNRPTNGNPGQFSYNKANKYPSYGVGFDDGGNASPWFGSYMLLSSLDVRDGEGSDYIDRWAYAQIDNGAVGIQAEPYQGPILPDGSFLQVMRTNHNNQVTPSNEGLNTYYLTRIYPRLPRADHDHVMNTGTLPAGWDCT